MAHIATATTAGRFRGAVGPFRPASAAGTALLFSEGPRPLTAQRVSVGRCGAWVRCQPRSKRRFGTAALLAEPRRPPLFLRQDAGACVRNRTSVVVPFRGDRHPSPRCQEGVLRKGLAATHRALSVP